MMADIVLPQIVSLIFIAFVGLCLGSFATALIYRIPRRISWIVKEKGEASRSCCPSCGQRLKARDLVPLFSWLLMRGRCRYCKNKIPAFYPLVELTVMMLCLLLYWAWGPVWSLIPVLLSVPFLTAALLIDWDHMILPDDINISLALLALSYAGILWLSTGEFPMNNFASALVITGILWAVSAILGRLKGQEALGMGDLKFLPSAGLFIGMAALPTYLGMSGIFGVGTALLKQKINENKEFPFGPALIISLYIHLILTGLGFDYTW